MQELMTNPVRLPSGMVVDEKTILKHLLNEKTVRLLNYVGLFRILLVGRH